MQLIKLQPFSYYPYGAIKRLEVMYKKVKNTYIIQNAGIFLYYKFMNRKGLDSYLLSSGV
jgi:hypothetical protein